MKTNTAPAHRRNRASRPRSNAFFAALALPMAVLASTGASAADQRIYSAGPYEQDGYQFVRRVTKYVGRGWESVNVQLNCFDYELMRFGARELKGLQAHVDEQDYNPSSGYVTFVIRGGFYDYHYTDDYEWTVNYTVLMLD